jgi:hypothetical protein
MGNTAMSYRARSREERKADALAKLQRRGVRWLIAGIVLLLTVGTGLMLGLAPRTHHCIHVSNAIDLTGPCGEAP